MNWGQRSLYQSIGASNWKGISLKTKFRVCNNYRQVNFFFFLIPHNCWGVTLYQHTYSCKNEQPSLELSVKDWLNSLYFVTVHYNTTTMFKLSLFSLSQRDLLKKIKKKSLSLVFGQEETWLAWWKGDVVFSIATRWFNHSANVTD